MCLRVIIVGSTIVKMNYINIWPQKRSSDTIYDENILFVGLFRPKIGGCRSTSDLRNEALHSEAGSTSELGPHLAFLNRLLSIKVSGYFPSKTRILVRNSLIDYIEFVHIVLAYPIVSNECIHAFFFKKHQ